MEHFDTLFGDLVNPMTGVAARIVQQSRSKSGRKKVGMMCDAIHLVNASSQCAKYSFEWVAHIS